MENDQLEKLMETASTIMSKSHPKDKEHIISLISRIVILLGQTKSLHNQVNPVLSAFYDYANKITILEIRHDL